MKIWLLISGGLTLLVLAMPWLVIVGLFMLVLPGLILGIMPTFFFYLLATAVIRSFLPLPVMPATVAAAVIAVAIGWLAVQPAQIAAKARFAAAQQPDVMPPAPIVPSGHILLERARFIGKPEECDALCAALLATPGVASVTLVNASNDKAARTTYRLVPKGSVPDTGLRPTDVSTFRDYRERDGYKQREADEKALAASWALRLATSETLVAEAARERFDMTIAMTDRDRNSDSPRVERLEVSRGDSLLLRRSVVSHRMLAAPLHLTIEGAIENTRWAVARTALRTGGRYEELKHQDELVTHIALAAPQAKQESREELRKRLVDALAAPGAQPDLALSSVWLELFGFKSPEGEDGALVAKILADPRITDLAPFFKSHEKRAPVALRGALATRILMPTTSPQDRTRLARLLKEMPAGTFASMTADERTILGKFAYRKDSAPLIERLADRGPAALPDLVAILQDSAAIEPWRARENLVRGARRGLARLGPAAKPALPLVLRLFAQNRLGDSWRNSVEWRVAMVRMGLPPEQLPWPESWKPEQISRERAEIVEAVAKRDATFESGYNY